MDGRLTDHSNPARVLTLHKTPRFTFYTLMLLSWVSLYEHTSPVDLYGYAFLCFSLIFFVFLYFSWAFIIGRRVYDGDASIAVSWIDGRQGSGLFS
jgi:hypothetical protein